MRRNIVVVPPTVYRACIAQFEIHNSRVQVAKASIESVEMQICHPPLEGNRKQEPKQKSITPSATCCVPIWIFGWFGIDHFVHHDF